MDVTRSPLAPVVAWLLAANGHKANLTRGMPADAVQTVA